MARNQELLTALRGLDVDEQATKTAKFAALDALIHVDLANAIHFRQAVVAHAAIFGATFANQDTASDDFLNAFGDDTQGGHPDANNLRALQRVAAERRVLLGMISMPIADLKVIAGIAAPDALRALLVTKPALGELSTGNNWAGAPLDPPLLTDEVLGGIKEHARQLVIQTIQAQVRKIEVANSADARVANDALALIPRQVGPLLNTSIDTVIRALTPMNTKLQQLQTYLVANGPFLDLAENQDAKRAIDAGVLCITQEITRTKAAATTASLRVVQDKAALVADAVGRLDIANVTPDALKAAMEPVAANFATISKAFQLVEASGAPAEIDAARLHKNTAEQMLVNVQIYYFTKVAIAESRAVTDKIAEININNGTEESKHKMLGDAEALLRSAQKAYAAAVDAKEKATVGLFDALNLDRLNKLIAQTKEVVRDAQNAIGSVRIMLSPQAETPDFGNMYMKHARLMEQFTDKFVKKADAAAELASVAAAAPPAPRGAVSARTANANETTFERVNLATGDCIYSTARFNKEINNGAPDPMVTGKLMQDHTGKVTDMTTDQLSPRQQEMMAIKQADMLLTNYKPGSGNIIIGPVDANPNQANRVYAALLGLMAAHPSFKDVEIDSEVPGCFGPVAGYLTTNARAKAAFIQQYLPTTASLLKGEKEQVRQFIDVKDARHTTFQEMKKGLSESKSAREKMDKAQKIQGESLKEGDNINLEGSVVPTKRGP